MLKWILGFASGVSSLLFIPWLLPNYSLLILALVALVLLYSTKSRYFQSKLLTSGLTFLSALLLGVLYSQIQVQLRYANSIKAPLDNMEHIIEARISSIPAIYDDYSEFFVTISNTKPFSQESPLANKKIKLKWYRSQQVPQLGDLWSFKIKLKPLQAAINQGGYDFERSMFLQQVDAVGYIKGQALQLGQTKQYSLALFRNKLYQSFESFTNVGVLQALVLGEKRRISKQQREILSHFGLNHLFAISGLHIAILAGFGLLIGRLSWGFLPYLRDRVSPLSAGLLLSCLIAVSYAALAGFSLPTQRATIMWLAFACSQLISRQIKIEQSLALALLIVLLISPFSVLSASFWMTFLAVLIISIIMLGRIGKSHWFLSLLRLQLALSLSLGLVALLWFQQASLASVLVNLIAIPVFSLMLLPAIFIGLIITLLFQQNILLVFVDSLLTQLTLWAGQLRVATPFLSTSISLEASVLVLLVILSIFIWLPINKLKKPLLISGLLIALVFQSAKKQAPLRMEIFDVGHGLAVLFHNQNTAILYDTGFGNAAVSAAEMYILPSLNKLGIDKLDLLFVSHSDNDHAGGVKALIDKLPIGQIVSSKPWLNQADISLDQKYQLCYQGHRWQFAELKLEALYPPSEQKDFSSANNSSCVLKVSYQEQSVLLAGDIEKDAELSIASDPKIASKLASTILLAPHHGSKTSSSYPFIKKVSPATVVYSTDRYNRYRMPHPSIKKRYQDFKIQELQTGCRGQISYDFIEKSWSFMRAQQKIWRKPLCK